MAIYSFNAQIISRGNGRSAVAAAAYRHRTRMLDERVGTHHPNRNAEDLVHEELSMPDSTPAWLRTLVDGRTVAGASEAF